LTGVPDQIHQVIVNILLNAVDAVNHLENPKVTVRTWKEEDVVKLSITDNGKGINKDEQIHNFEPFYTTKEVGKGTGLGLSVSHGIISEMGGKITVHSTEGKGTTFSISLEKEPENALMKSPFKKSRP